MAWAQPNHGCQEVGPRNWRARRKPYRPLDAHGCLWQAVREEGGTSPLLLVACPPARHSFHPSVTGVWIDRPHCGMKVFTVLAGRQATKRGEEVPRDPRSRFRDGCVLGRGSSLPYGLPEATTRVKRSVQVPAGLVSVGRPPDTCGWASPRPYGREKPRSTPLLCCSALARGRTLREATAYDNRQPTSAVTAEDHV